MTYVRESTNETHLRKVARKHGFIVRKLAWVGRRNAPDDALMKSPGIIIFVELKTKGGKLSPGQIREHERLRAMGFRVAVLWSKEAIDEYFK
jgi:G:T-mismatch repair DNA endonuclease (very short patch repair protein)